MGYCPNCDMEFIDGVIACTDCGGSLVESKEAAIAMKKKEQEEMLFKQREYLEKLNQQLQEESAGQNPPENFLENSVSEELLASLIPKPVQIYESKAQKYEDLKSSAFAFLMAGGLLLTASAVCWSSVVSIPMTGISRLIFQGALSFMGFFSLAVFFTTSRSARQLRPEIETEKKQTEELIQWFLGQWKGDNIDKEIENYDSLSQEELSLKRFQIIQDYLVTNKDLPDPAYVDALSEELYSRLYES